MTDIDFDELDRAVNSLMGNVKGEEVVRKGPKTLSVNTTLADDELPSFDKIEAAARRIGSEAIEAPREQTAVLPDASRSSSKVGRFMDVFHPSSDMKTSTTVKKAQMSVDETGAKVLTLPSRESSVADAPAVDVPESAAEVVTPVPATPAVSAESNVVVTTHKKGAVVRADRKKGGRSETKSHTKSILPSTEAVEPATKADDAARAGELEANAADEPTEPLTSPFITDAKVEKRPLGGASDEKAQKQPPTDVVDLPEEFGDDLLAVETSLAVDASDPQAVEAAIPKNAIFDVDEYHKPLGADEHHVSAWVWVGVAVLILVLGAAAGMGIFLLAG